MKIIADTATLISPAEGQGMGLTVVPVGFAVEDIAYRDYIDIDSDTFLQLLKKGAIPTSSQPSVGDVLQTLDEAHGEEVIFLTVGDGLSGAYQTAMAARNMVDNCQNIHIVNSKTLAGPLRYMAKKALQLKTAGQSAAKIIECLQTSIESSMSFVIPENFEFLRRSGRLTAMTAKIGTTLKLLPVLTQTADKTRIKPVAIRHSWKGAVDVIIQKLSAAGIDRHYLLSVCHAGTADRAKAVADQIAAAFKTVDVEILQLSPALITHGGPGCIVVQAVAK